MPKKNLDQVIDDELDNSHDVDISQIEFDVSMSMQKPSLSITKLNNLGRN